MNLQSLLNPQSQSSSAFSDATINPFLRLGQYDNTELYTHAQTKIYDSGWVVVSNFSGLDEAEVFVKNFGELMPQYDGTLRYDVKAKQQFEKFQYSQSSNTIQPHTEAPVFAPPPRYLALYCNRQARCGGGYTDFADGYKFIESLDPETKAKLTSQNIDFSGSRLPSGKSSLKVKTPVLSLSETGKPILRFSYNAFFYNDLHPVIESEGGQEADHGNEYLKTLAKLGFEFFHSERVQVLIPENAVLIWDNHRMMHARSKYEDKARHLTRFWVR